jgi:hypothetical protein
MKEEVRKEGRKEGRKEILFSRRVRMFIISVVI